MLSSVSGFRAYGLQYEKENNVERCYVLYWNDKHLMKICIGCESLDQAMPLPELVPLSRIVCSLGSTLLPIAILGGSPSLLRVLENDRSDARRFVIYEKFDEEVFLRCVQQADQDIFGMVNVITLVDYLLQRLKSALYEAWTEGKVVLRKCIRQRSVDFMDYRQLLTEFIELWSCIRPFIRCTGHPGAKGKADSVSQIYCFYVVSICVLFPPSFFFYSVNL